MKKSVYPVGFLVFSLIIHQYSGLDLVGAINNISTQKVEVFVKVKLYQGSGELAKYVIYNVSEN